MKTLLILSLSIFNLFGGVCYTAQNGFRAVTDISNKMQEKSNSTKNRVDGLYDTLSIKEEKLKEIAKLEKEIRDIKNISYLKTKSILAHLKTKNSLENNSITVEQISNELKGK